MWYVSLKQNNQNIQTKEIFPYMARTKKEKLGSHSSSKIAKSLKRINLDDVLINTVQELHHHLSFQLSKFKKGIGKLSNCNSL